MFRCLVVVLASGCVLPKPLELAPFLERAKTNEIAAVDKAQDYEFVVHGTISDLSFYRDPGSAPIVSVDITADEGARVRCRFAVRKSAAKLFQGQHVSILGFLLGLQREGDSKVVLLNRCYLP